MKGLLLLLVAVLGCVLAERGLQTFDLKCTLRKKLTEAIGNLSAELGKKTELPVEKIVTWIVCHAENASGFDFTKLTKMSVPDDRAPEKQAEVWTLYGLFQLSNHIVCEDDNSPPSTNLCQMKCDKFLDEDVGDDITCLLILLRNLHEKSRHV